MLRSRLSLAARRRVCLSCYSTSASPASAPAPLLKRIREDLKAAMRAKDSARLDVLRGLISDTTNAEKASNAVTTDSHMLQIIRKRIKSSEDATTEAINAKRDDLVGKERQQISILESYSKDSGVMSEDDARTAVQQMIDQMGTDGKQTNIGTVMKALVGPGGSLDGKVVDRKEIARVVDGMLSVSKPSPVS